MSFGSDSFSEAAISSSPSELEVVLSAITRVGAFGSGVLAWPPYTLFISAVSRAGASGSAELFLALEGVATRAGASGAATLSWENYTLDLESTGFAGARGGTAPLSYPVAVEAQGLVGALGFATFSSSRQQLRTTTRVGAAGTAIFTVADYIAPLHVNTRVGAKGKAQLSGPTVFPLYANTRVGAAGTLSVPYQTWNPIPVFPDLPVGFPVTVKPTFATVLGEVSSGRSMRGAEQQLPIWEFELNFETLRDQTQNQQPFEQFSGIDEFLKLSQLFVASIGQYGRFLFDAWWDDTRLNQPIALGDGTSVAFTMVRAWGYDTLQFTEPVGYVGTITDVKIDGTVQDSSTYSIINGNVLTFNTAPRNGGYITSTFMFYYLCQFATDQHDYSEFFKDRWSTKIPFRSIVGGLGGSIISPPVYPPPPPPPPPPQPPQPFVLGFQRLATGNTITLPITGAGIPANSLIVIGGFVKSAGAWTATLSVDDSASNSYTSMLTNGGSLVYVNEHIRGGLFYVYNSIALVAGDSITMTSSISLIEGGGIGGLYVPNGGPHEGGVDNVIVDSSFGAGPTATVIAAAAPGTNSIMIGYGCVSTNAGPTLSPSGTPWTVWLTGDNTGYSFSGGFVASYIVTSSQLSWTLSNFAGANFIGITAFAAG